MRTLASLEPRLSSSFSSLAVRKSGRTASNEKLDESLGSRLYLSLLPVSATSFICTLEKNNNNFFFQRAKKLAVETGNEATLYLVLWYINPSYLTSLLPIDLPVQSQAIHREQEMVL